ncbi:unnamed protein product [Dovyalis caffra]|uniref:Uncharacterized protein n=1 Tax=Dovyalis caffra TaxID=77055 RepID=A0AAV1RE92_9ROSI|nr:unnamed protein product [Dovyalis caffra]
MIGFGGELIFAVLVASSFSMRPKPELELHHHLRAPDILPDSRYNMPIFGHTHKKQRSTPPQANINCVHGWTPESQWFVSCKIKINIEQVPTHDGYPIIVIIDSISLLFFSSIILPIITILFPDILTLADDYFSTQSTISGYSEDCISKQKLKIATLTG